jgi:predicted RNA-binding protein with PIN domain
MVFYYSTKKSNRYLGGWIGRLIIIIDAYNVLKYFNQAKYITDKQREQFISLLADYAKHKKHTLLAVFDGGDYDRPAHFKKNGITVIYSGHTTTADSVVISLLKNYTGSAVVISNDKEIHQYALKNNVQVVSSQQFYEYLDQATSIPLPRVVQDKRLPQKRKGHSSSQEVDQLMELASSIVVHKDERVHPDQNKRSDKSVSLSKKEKKKLNVIRKL